MKWGIALIVLLYLPLTRVARAGEEGAVADSTAAWEMAPRYESSIQGDVTKVSLGQRLSSSFSHGPGMQFTSSIDVDESKYRLQDRKDVSKTWTNSLRMQLKPGLFWSSTYSDTRVFNRIISLSGGLQDFIVNTQQVGTSFNYSTRLPGGGGLDARAGVNASSSEKVFKKDKSMSVDVAGGVGYRFSNRIKFEGRAAYSDSRARSETGIGIFSGIGEEGDSLLSRVTVDLSEIDHFQFLYTRATGTRNYIDLPRGLYFEQKLGSEDLVEETQITDSRVISLDATTHPLGFVELKMSADHREDLSDFKVTKKRFNRTVKDDLKAKLSYSYGAGSRVSFTAERSEQLNDLGPFSVSSFTRKQKNTTLQVRHVFSNTLSAVARAGATLSQVFYLDFETNPRDRDQLNQFAQLQINSRPYRKIQATIFLAVTSIDYVSIDKSFSINNRRETTYDLRPQFVYELNDRIEISQNYGVNIEFTDYVFTDNENFLDRNFTFSNGVKAKLSKNLSIDFHYGLLLHDRGSYLRASPVEERVLRINEEDRKDIIRISMRYRINSHLTAIAEHEYGRRRDRIVSTGAESIFPDGTIRGGLEGRYKWGGDRTLSFSLLKVSRFGTFNIPEQNDYWMMKSNFKYAF